MQADTMLNRGSSYSNLKENLSVLSSGIGVVNVKRYTSFKSAMESHTSSWKLLVVHCSKMFQYLLDTDIDSFVTWRLNPVAVIKDQENTLYLFSWIQHSRINLETQKQPKKLPFWVVQE